MYQGPLLIKVKLDQHASNNCQSTTGPTSFRYNVSEPAHGELSIHLEGRMDVGNAAAAFRDLRSLMQKKAAPTLTLDLAELAYLDDFGAHVILELQSIINAQRGAFQIVNAAPQVSAVFEQASYDNKKNAAPVKRKKSAHVLERLGEATMIHCDNVRYMIAFIGSVALCFLKVCLNPKSLRVEDTITHMEKTGVDALPIVALVSFLLGLIMAFMSALQLQQFGANIYIASLVALAMVSELGPIMTAIIVAGRSGSAYAAEIGTMKISEEIDALFVMGFNPTHFLAIPRILAALLVVPLLTLFSDLFAIAGGLLIGVTMLDLSMSSYINQTIETLTFFELAWGLAKSAVFAVIVAWTGCLRGFQARGGAAAVGNAATSAVVTSIFLIILFDSIFAVIRSYW